MKASLPNAFSRRHVIHHRICLVGRALVVLVLMVSLMPGLSGKALAADGVQVTTDGFERVDLRPFAMKADDPVARQFSELPMGDLVFHDIPFRVGPPLALTGIEAALAGDFFPPSVTGIKVGRAARRIHLLHATSFAEKDGTPLAKIVFHYANGAGESVRLGYGVHARAWVTPRLEKRAELFDPHSQLAWSETDNRRGAGLRLFVTALENPRPAEVIDRIDLVSLFSHATPLLAALTIEELGATKAALASSTARKVVRDLKDFPDSVYRGELSVRVTDAETGAAVTNAVATLSITDDKESFHFGSTSADAGGELKFPYPPLHAVGISIWVHAPGRMPVVISESKTNVNQFAGRYSVALKRGATIGGVVKSSDGQPVAGAQVIIHQVALISAHHYKRTDYDAVATGTDGRWTSQSAPPNLAGLSLQVSHPQYRTVFYATDGYAPQPTNNGITTTTVRTTGRTTSTTVTSRDVAGGGSTIPLITSNALLTAGAEMKLQPAIVLEGTLADADGRFIPAAELIVQRLGGEPKYLRTDATGRFQTRIGEPGDAALIVLRDGFAPLQRRVNIAPGMAPVALVLGPARVLQGRVQDRGTHPISGARVRLDAWNGMSDLLRFQAFTDEQGAFTWSNAPSDQITFYVSKTNYNNSTHSTVGSSGRVVINLNGVPRIYGRVYDVETGKPVESFTLVPGRKYSQGEKQIHWDRSDSMRGFGGEYSLRVSTYYFQPEARVLVESPGYEPQVSRAFMGIDAYTNDFALKKGRGVGGLVQWPDGSPVVGATLAIIEKGEVGYLDPTSQVRGNGGSADLARTDAQGRFEFTPRLEPEKIFVSHEQGFGEAKVADVLKGGKITLQKWGQIKGVVRVGDQPEPGQTLRLQGGREMTVDGEGRGAGFSFSLKADPDGDGSFIFEKVPPGEHRLALEYGFKDDRNGDMAWSHGFLVDVKPGTTATVTLGGTGRRVTGRVKILGGDASDMDWRQDVHRLMLILPVDTALPVNGRAIVTETPVLSRGQNQPIAPPMTVEAMRERERAGRTYVLLFDTNGTFRVEHVPPGRYNLVLNVTDPEDEYYNRRTIGSLNQQIVIPDDKTAKVNAPFDLGELSLTIRPRVKLGKTVPSFDAKTSDGKTIRLSDFKGRPVLLHFWGMSLGFSSYDFQVLKELQASHGSQGRLVILGCNLDADEANARQFAKGQGMTWTQTFLGQWDQSPVAGMFGINGNSACVLIDAEGKLASGQMRGSNIRSGVANLQPGE